MNISLAAEPLFHLGDFTVTNSFLASVVTSTLLIGGGYYISKKISSSKPTGFQAVIEEAYIFINDLAESVGGKYSRRFVPLVLTFFFFILFSNWMGLLPGFGSIILNKIEHGHVEEVPLLRGATADLNTTLALAIVSVFSIQFYGVSKLKMSYFKKFIDLSNPIKFFVGILEIISEIAKVVSFSFRLFGNIFAGEVLIAVIISLLPVIAPLPFFGLEIFVGIIQALVFALLTLVFIQMGTISHDDEEHGVNKEHKEIENETKKLGNLAGEGVEYGN